MGAIAGGGVALAFGGEGHWWVLPLMLLAGAAGGAAWAAIPALLKTRFNAHEILTTLMLSYVAMQFLGWLVHGPWIDPEGFNFPQTRMFADDALLPILVEGSRLHAGALLALLAVPLAWLLLSRTVTGFRLRTVGLAPDAARYAGFSATGAVWFSLVLSGALAGLAGVLEAAGPVGQLQPSMSPGYGFAAIIVAFIGRLHPVGILGASLLMALLYLGGEQLQVSHAAADRGDRDDPGHAAVLPAGHRRLHRPAPGRAAGGAACLTASRCVALLVATCAPRRRCCWPASGSWWPNAPACSTSASRG